MKKNLFLTAALVAGMAFAQECAKPYNVTVEMTSANSVTVDAGNSTLTYDIVSTANPGNINLATATPTFNNVSSPYTVNRLAPNWNYEFYVRVDCGDSVSEWVGPFTFTSVATAVCPAPENINIIDITQNGGTFSAEGSPNLYDVISTGQPETLDITMLNENSEVNPFLSDVSSTHSITGLPSNHTFEYYVRRDCGQVETNLNVSPWAGPFYFTTASECNVPTGVTVVSTGDTWATFTADDTTATYDIVSTALPGTIPVNANGQPTMAPQTTGVTAPFTYEGLAPGYTYEYYVRNACGSDYVGPFTFTTTGGVVAKVTPNPTTGLVQFNGFDAVSAQVVNFTGRVQATLNVVNNEINISNLTPGNYVINAVDAKGNVQSFKVVKK